MTNRREMDVCTSRKNDFHLRKILSGLPILVQIENIRYFVTRSSCSRRTRSSNKWNDDALFTKTFRNTSRGTCVQLQLLDLCMSRWCSKTFQSCSTKILCVYVCVFRCIRRFVCLSILARIDFAIVNPLLISAYSHRNESLFLRTVKHTRNFRTHVQNERHTHTHTKCYFIYFVFLSSIYSSIGFALFRPNILTASA